MTRRTGDNYSGARWAFSERGKRTKATTVWFVEGTRLTTHNVERASFGFLADEPFDEWSLRLQLEYAAHALGITVLGDWSGWEWSVVRAGEAP